MCADGKKQGKKSDKKITTSLTAATKSVLIPMEIDSTKRRSVAVVDIPRAFLAEDMDKLVSMLPTGELAKIMESISPKTYQDYL